MALLGVDHGSSHIDAAIYYNGQIQQVLFNGDRKITSSVFISDRLYFGNDAMVKGKAKPQQLLRNLKRFIGHDIDFIARELEANSSFRVFQEGDMIMVEVVGLNVRYPLLYIVIALLRYVVENAMKIVPEISLLLLPYPPSWNENQKAIYKQCAEQLGIPCFLLTETVASALNTGFRPEKQPVNLLVVDGGGGTFDVTSLRITKERGYEVIVTDGLQIGGFNCTERVLTDMEQQLRYLDALGKDETLSPKDRARLWPLAEETKIQLKSQDTWSLDVDLKGESYHLVYTRQHLNNLCESLLRECLQKVRDVIQRSEEKGCRPTTCLPCGELLKMDCFWDGISSLFPAREVYGALSCPVSRGAVAFGRTIKTPPVNPANPTDSNLPQVHEKRTYTLYMTKAKTTTGHDLRPIVKPSDNLPITKTCKWTAQPNKPLLVKLFEGREPFQSRCKCIRVLELARDENHPFDSYASYTSSVHVDAAGSVSMSFNWVDNNEEIQVINDYSPDRRSVIPRQVEPPITRTRPPLLNSVSTVAPELLPPQQTNRVYPSILANLVNPQNPVSILPHVPLVPPDSSVSSYPPIPFVPSVPSSSTNSSNSSPDPLTES